LTDVFHGFPQALKQNRRMVPKVGLRLT